MRVRAILDCLGQGEFGWAAEDIMVKIDKSYWDVGQYALGFCGAIGLLWLHKWNIRLFVVLVWMMKRELP